MNEIKKKIFLTSIIIITIIVGIIGYISLIYLQKLGEFPLKILSRNYKSINALRKMERAIDSQFTILTNQKTIDKKTVKELEKQKNIFISNLNIEKENITEKGESDIVKKIIKEYDLFLLLYEIQYKNQYNKIGLYKNPEAEKDIKEKYKKIYELISNAILLNEEAMYKSGHNTREMSRSVTLYLAILTIIVIIISIFPSYIFASQISSQIDALLLNLKKQEEEKINFMSSLSHQLKTPLTSLIMGISLLKDKLGSKLDAKEIDLISTIREDTIRLASLTNELLETSNWEYAKMKFDREKIDINEMIENSISPLKLQLDSKKISLKFNIEKKLPKIFVDPIKFPWIITNLVGNALRYTAEGGKIEILVKKEGDKIFFCVSDSGCGIDKEYLKNIFDRYHPFSKETKQKRISMGLPIVKEVIKNHNGDIEVQSEVGKGTTFTFWIPEEK